MKTNYGDMPGLILDKRTGRARMVRGGVVRTREAKQVGIMPIPSISAEEMPARLARLAGSTNPTPSPTSPWLSIVVMGEPMGKPRMTQRDKWKQRTTVVRYRTWCDRIRHKAGWTKKDKLLHPTVLTVRAYFSIPSKWSTLVKLHAAGTPHLHKPDIDNICKGVLDALIENDQMVYRIECEKYWDQGNGPCTFIHLA